MPCAARFPPGPLEALVRLPACRSWGGGWGQWLAEGEWPCGLELEDRPPSPARWRAECVWAQDSMALLSETGKRRGLLLHCAPGEEGGWPPGRFRWHSEAGGSSIQTRFLVSRGGGTGGAGSPCPASARGGRFCSRCPLAQVPGCRAAPQGPPRAAARVPCCCRGQAACPARSHAVWGVPPGTGTEWQPRGPGSWCPGLSWTHSALPRPAGAVVSPRDPEPGGTPWSSVRRSAAPRHGPRWRSRLRKASSTGSAWWGSGRVEVAPGSSGGGTTPA